MLFPLYAFIGIAFAIGFPNTCDELSISDVYDQVDYVFVGEVEADGVIDDRYGTLVLLTIREQFKSTFFVGYERAVIRIKPEDFCPVKFIPNTKYLIFGNSINEEKLMFTTNKSLRTKKLENSREELDYLQSLPCTRSERTQKACMRHFVEICGCNGITYSNACGASNAGIKQWKMGECQ